MDVLGFVAIVLLAIIVLALMNLDRFTRVVARAYFAEKLEYQRRFVKELDHIEELHKHG